MSAGRGFANLATAAFTHAAATPLLLALVLMATAVVTFEHPASAVAQGIAACDDGLDNDADGAVDRRDPGCGGRAGGTSEVDPSPVPSQATLTTARPYGCGIATGVEVLPDLTPTSLFPFGPVTARLRGLAGRARTIRITRDLPIAADDGYLFDRLLPGRYEVAVNYGGDAFRLPSATSKRRVTLPRSRCRVYVTGSGRRSYRPRTVYFGASQRIYAIRWRRWGGPLAIGVGIRPVNDCIPFCAAGSITDHPVTIQLSRRRVCNGYIQYLTMRFTYRGRVPTGFPRRETVPFGSTCD